jgi:hypothetical protein
VDYRGLNLKTRKNTYPLPLIQECIDFRLLTNGLNQEQSIIFVSFWALQAVIDISSRDLARLRLPFQTS